MSYSVTPGPAACQTSLSFTTSQSLLKLMSIELMMPSSHLILCHPILLLPSIFPTIRVFSDESVLHLRWPKYWSFSFSTSSSSEYSRLISFRIDLISLLSKGPSTVVSSTKVWKHQFLGIQPSLWSSSHIRTWLLEKPYRPLSAKWYLSFWLHCLGLSYLFSQGGSVF